MWNWIVGQGVFCLLSWAPVQNQPHTSNSVTMTMAMMMLIGGDIFVLVNCIKAIYMSHVTRKHFFGVSDLVKLKGYIAGRGIILSRQRTTNALIRLRGCAGLSAPLLFTYGKSRFCHDVDHIVHCRTNEKLVKIFCARWRCLWLIWSWLQYTTAEVSLCSFDQTWHCT